MIDMKPLHVRVAERMGWCDVQTLGKRETGEHAGPDVWVGRRPGAFDIEGFDFVPPYGEDSWQGWACTGPLLTKAMILRVDILHDKVHIWYDSEMFGLLTVFQSTMICDGIAQAYLLAKAAH